MEKTTRTKQETVTTIQMNRNEFEELITIAAAKEIEKVMDIAIHEGNDNIAKFYLNLLVNFTANVVDNCNAILQKKSKEEN